MISDEFVAGKIREMPDRPGIYVFKNERGSAIYVGKAKSLRKRAASYLRDDLEPRIAAMAAEATDIDFVVTDSEAEALLLENNWIKRRKPRYNILLRDDKTYPYIKLTTAEEYPRVVFTRRVVEDGAEYFGPFLPAGLARRAVKLVQKFFQIRVCHIPIDGSLPRPCLYHDMRRCLGPCVAGLTSETEYRDAVEDARLFLAGRTRDLIRRLKAAMGRASENLEFEQAARLRDSIREIETVSDRRKLSSVDGEDVDIFGLHVEAGRAAVVILVMRGGQVLDRRELFWEDDVAIAPQQLLSDLLPQFYDRTTFVPKEIHLPLAIEGIAIIEDWLSGKKGERSYIRLPSRGPKAQRLGLAMRNAKLAHQRRFRERQEDAMTLSGLQSSLDLPEPPRRIEGIDVSTLQGNESVASIVVWEEGRLRKSEYRSLNIRGLLGADDFAAMRQAVRRRYSRVLEETGTMPDLLLVDGGRGQLNAALEALAELGVEETPVVGLAKREEEVYLPVNPEPLRLARRDPGLRLLQRIRDEAHRFALDRHQKRRRKRTLRSALDDLAGVGPRRRQVLLREFGDLSTLRQARLEAIQAVVGPITGKRIFDQLRADPN